ncbi:MAG TPA: YihY/virulence factor BrkB family protein [bacterium]|nr:YihY/virulence factor BrkB family protein [bacterium]
MRSVGNIFKSFWRDDCLNLAENIAFGALLAVIPIGMMMVSITGYFLRGSEEAFNSVVAMATNVLPVGRDMFVANLESILSKRSSLGIVGIGSLVFIATLLTSSIERSLDIVFKAVRRRNFFHSRLLGIALIFWITLLFSLPTMAQVLEGILARTGFIFPLSELMGGKAFFVFVAFLAYVMTVVVIPNPKVYIRYACVGGVVFALGLGVAKLLFRWYMLFSVNRYNVIFGSLAVAVLFVVWVYYLSVLLLFTAELVAELQKRRLFHGRGKKIISREEARE